MKNKSNPVSVDSDLNDSAEMYYNYNSSSSCSYSKSYSTFQQSTRPEGSNSVNVEVPSAIIPLRPSAIPLRGKEKEPRKNIPRKIDPNHRYVQINVSINNIRRGKRTDRLNAYFSLRDENDKKFTIYLRSSLTTSIDETVRSIKKNGNQPLLYALTEMGSNCPHKSKLFTGRVKYNPRRYKIEDEHKHNLKSALVAIYDNGDSMTCVLFMFTDYYVIELTDDLTDKQTGLFDYTGSYQIDSDEEV